MPKISNVRAISPRPLRNPHGARVLTAAISGVLGCTPFSSFAQDGPDPEEVIVTATRRVEKIQDVPLNISAVSGDSIQEQGLSDLAEVARTVPGLYVVDQGARTANQIIVRGLNANSVSGSEALGNSGGDLVGTYIGEIPLYLDLKPLDLERVEVLMGPQGTLYGRGTMGGAIRYIPRRPELNATTVQLRADAYDLAESRGLGTDVGFTANLPLNDQLAFRASLGYLDDPGFVDYNYLVREAGVSDPEPDFSDPADVAANLKRKRDADDEQTWAGRAALRYQPIDALDINLTYYYQDQETGGRTVDQRAAFDTPRYVSAARFEEPNDRRNQLLALEWTADLGFAELTSATGYSRYRESGSRDQTDLLITLEYGYEAFPSFAAYTHEFQKDKTFNQELRLVSKTDGPLDWIVGAFYNRLRRLEDSSEFTPGYGEYVTGGVAGVDFREDALEYFSRDKTDQKEMALYGELQYHITDAWQVTLGGRYYKYKLKTRSAVLIPLFDIDPGPLEYEPGGQKKSSSLFKLNTSYEFSDDVMAYFTVSEGYRLGNSNGVVPCDPDDETNNQNGCGQPDELSYKPDTTTNYEIGVRTEWLDERVIANGSIYYIDWQDPQLNSTTDNAALPITRNGKGARSQGFELAIDAHLTPQLTVAAGYAYADAELTDDAPGLLNTYVPPGFNSTRIDVDGEKGDRLPGSPKHQGSVWTSYRLPFGGYDLELNYGLTMQSDILTKAGGRANGEKLGGFTVHNASVVVHADAWTVGLYAKNLFNKYAATGVRSTRASIQSVTNDDGDIVRVRSYYHDLLRPRQVGLRFTYDFTL